MNIIKDKNKPKGAKSPYACFVQAFREEHRRAFPNESVGFAEFSKKCALKWKELTPEERKQFEDIANRDKERYQEEMKAYLPANGRRSLKRRRDPNQPKRGLSAFFCFCEANRPEVRAEHPDWKVGEIAKEMGRRWEACKDKSKFEEMAQADKERYEREMVEYKNMVKVQRADNASQQRAAAAAAAAAAASSTHTQVHHQQQQQQQQQAHQQQNNNQQLQQHQAQLQQLQAQQQAQQAHNQQHQPQQVMLQPSHNMMPTTMHNMIPINMQTMMPATVQSMMPNSQGVPAHMMPASMQNMMPASMQGMMPVAVQGMLPPASMQNIMQNVNHAGAGYNTPYLG